MKVLVLIHEYPPVGTGGGQVAEGIARRLVNLGSEVCVITPNVQKNKLFKEEVRDGVLIIRVATNRKLLHQATLLNMTNYIFSALRPTWKIVRDWKPDIIHVHFAVPAGTIAWVITRFMKVPYILTTHLGDIPGGAPDKTRAWFRWIFPFTPLIWKSAAKLTAISEFSRNLALQSYPLDIQVIPNGVEYKNGLNNKIRVGKTPRIIFAGRFVTQKNPILFVQTLAQLKDLPWDCIMLGDGPLFSDTKVEIAKNNLQKRIKLQRWVTSEKVVEELNKSDILFMPSLSEGMPIVGLQA